MEQVQAMIVETLNLAPEFHKQLDRGVAEFLAQSLSLLRRVVSN